MYAIVDIETTGGYAENHRITEVAIYHHDGMHITDVFHTLINPEEIFRIILLDLRASLRKWFWKHLALRK